MIDRAAIALLLSAFAAGAQAHDPLSPEQPKADVQRVRIHTPSHLPQASQVETVYGANCASRRYLLRVSPAKKTVMLEANDLPVTDLSATTVGARLLDGNTIVQVGFNCPLDALNIFLQGVKLIDYGVTPEGFRDMISVRVDGSVSKSSPSVERLDELPVHRPTR